MNAPDLGPGRLRRTIWNWLPAFLEVAETGSVARAARQLGLTPAAVSRTVRLLEGELGEPLFNRVGRGLVLNRAGAALRDAARAAVAAVDGGLGDTLAEPFAGPLRVASLGVLTESFVVPTLIDLKAAHPALVPEHVNVRAAEANTLLVRGELDLAFYYEELSAEAVVIERLGELGASVYCGRGHPLFGRRRVTRADVLAHPFSVPQLGDTGRVMDGWPPEIARQVGMRITLLRSNLDVCESGVLLTVLPDVTAAPLLRRRLLRRLPGVELPAIEVFAGRHAAAVERPRAQAVIDGVKARLRGRG